MPATKQPSDVDYINYLIAARCDVSCVKVADCYSTPEFSISHDTFNRFLTRQSLTPEALWEEVEPHIERKSGWLVLDDTVLDKNHSKKIEATYYQSYIPGKPNEKKTKAVEFRFDSKKRVKIFDE